MDGKTYRQIVAIASVFGFVGGWICGVFLALMACWTLFAEGVPTESVILVGCALLVCGLFFLLQRAQKRKALCSTGRNRAIYFLFGSVLGWLISGQFLK